METRWQLRMEPFWGQPNPFGNDRKYLLASFAKAKKMTSHQVTNIYFETNEAPTKKAVVLLNASTKRNGSII
jgi:hypothetical protein